MTAESAEITIRHEAADGFAIVRPAGKLDTMSAKTFETYLRDLVDNKSGALLIDMADVDYVTSFGLRSLLIIAKLMAPSGDQLILFQVNPSVLDVLKISGFLKILKVVDTQDDAKGLAGQSA
ncbi:STAS domain-containing protein [Roseibium sp. MMSF_3544]|uniref:STAS domain-containing protein n=1 Tax=unclassified Roseibium TaxID=2629323 RepID=UPI00273FAA27|nr:STAS domain-containing protein [Roseibium sp. MMSF_3544]